MDNELIDKATEANVHTQFYESESKYNTFTVMKMCGNIASTCTCMYT